MRCFGALFTFLVGFPLLAQRVPVYTVDLTHDDVRATRQSTIELRPVDGADAPIRISFAPSDEPTVFEAAVLRDGCDPSSTEIDGCDRMSFDPYRGHVEMRSFARQKGVSLALNGAPTLFRTTVPLRIETQRTVAGSPAEVRITASSVPKARERITYEVNVGGRRHALAVDFNAVRSPATLLPLAALLSDVIGRESPPANAVPQTTGPVDTSKKPPTSGGAGAGRSCFICDLCSNLPGGQTLGGCLGPPSLGGGGGGSGSPGCKIATETALEIFQTTLMLDTTGSSFCEDTFASTIGTHVARFNKEATRFQAKVDTPGLDLKSKSCAACFRDMARLFSTGGAGITEIKGILSGNCIKDYATLKTHTAQFTTMKGRAQRFLDDQALCKKGCDGSPASPAATHRAYCDCLALYLSWAPAPYPGSASCPP